jgi:hypothetical protein
VALPLLRRLSDGSYLALTFAPDATARRKAALLAAARAGSGEFGELGELIVAGDARIRPSLLAWLTRQGNIDVLRGAADAGDDYARQRLAAWLARHDELAETGALKVGRPVPLQLACSASESLSSTAASSA